MPFSRISKRASDRNGFGLGIDGVIVMGGDFVGLQANGSRQARVYRAIDRVAP